MSPIGSRPSGTGAGRTPAHAPATATEESVMSSNGSAAQGSDHSSADRDRTSPDAIIVGAGLAGLVAAHELTRAGRRVLVIDQENRANLGGQAFWSLGGLFLIDTPEQRRLGVRDSSNWLRPTGPPRRDSTATRTAGRGRGPRRTSNSPP